MLPWQRDQMRRKYGPRGRPTVSPGSPYKCPKCRNTYASDEERRDHQVIANHPILEGS